MFLYTGAALNQSPTASFTSQCTHTSCTFDGSASADADGTVASYTWSFGDGESGSGVSPSHTFPDAGTYTVTLTAKDNAGGTGTTTRQVSVTAPPPNQAPTAAFSAQCDQADCVLDGSGSTDPEDGTPASYAWDFGDGTTGTGANATHGYAVTGSYTVTLEVKDSAGATNTVSHDVSVTVPHNPIAFVGASHSVPGATKVKQASVPAGAQVGDTLVLVFTKGSTSSWTGPAGISGWTQVDTYTNATVTTTVWTRVATADDLGKAVRMDNTAFQKAVLNLLVYSGVNASSVAVAHSGDSAKATHVTPSLNASAGDWMVSYWADKSAGTETWTAPSDVTTRDTAIDNGTSGRYGSLVSDSGGPVPQASYGGLTAAVNAPSEKAVMLTIGLSPAS
jgi:PKD repeat protein